ncbi:MAG TPA: hypothetical protein DD782_00860 [Firmicutes bacterium]|nr:hypothetical protein [Bacillota bacterium]HBL51480.1 hypothetical protein [Bacillota bacterium]HBL68786.1 hypothetical protein [Bacillota bacterium]HBR23089.1 hypothetical protein [Bacillota bacterium]HCF88382.1 hypothetical protein [Bacillota bacterium]
MKERARSFRRYQWGGWAVLAAAFFVVFVHRYHIAAVADNLAATPPKGLGLSGTALGNLASIYFYFYALMQIPSGILCDSIGARRTAFAGMAVAAIGAALTAFSGSLALISVSRALVGIGTAVIYVGVLRFLTLWFPTGRFATMTGCTSITGNFGAMTAATPLAMLVLYTGWRGSFIVLSVISLVVAVLVYLVVRDYPQDLGFPAVTEQAGQNGLALPELWSALKMIFRNRLTWLCFLIYLGASSATFSFNGLWGISYLMQVYQLPKGVASSYTLMVSLGIALGSLFWGWLSDQCKRKKPIVVGGVIVQGILWTLLITPAADGALLPRWLLPILLFLIGLSAIVFVLTFAAVKERNDVRYSGTAISVVNTGGFLGGALMNAAVGRMLDAGWQGKVVDGVRVFSQGAYHRAFLLFPVAIAMALICAIMLPGERACECGRGADLAKGHFGK